MTVSEFMDYHGFKDVSKTSYISKILKKLGYSDSKQGTNQNGVYSKLRYLPTNISSPHTQYTGFKKWTGLIYGKYPIMTAAQAKTYHDTYNATVYFYDATTGHHCRYDAQCGLEDMTATSGYEAMPIDNSD